MVLVCAFISIVVGGLGFFFGNKLKHEQCLMEMHLWVDRDLNPVVLKGIAKNTRNEIVHQIDYSWHWSERKEEKIISLIKVEQTFSKNSSSYTSSTERSIKLHFVKSPEAGQMIAEAIIESDM